MTPLALDMIYLGAVIIWIIIVILLLLHFLKKEKANKLNKKGKTMNTKDKMNKIKEIIGKEPKNKISKKELIDKVYADLVAKEKKHENDITEEDMKILEQYANSQSINDVKEKSSDELSEDATKALKDFFSK